MNAKIQTDSGDRLTVSEIGGFINLDLQQIPILIPVTRGDGKSIQTHVCTPNFGKDLSGIYELKQHGNMRNEACDITQNISTINIRHDITDSPHIFPKGVSTTISITLEKGFCSFTIVHKNNGTLPAPINCGVHCYFSAPQSYRGTVVNDINITKFVEQTGNIDLLSTNIIKIPAMPPILMTQSGFNKAVLWVGENKSGIKDSHYVCIEPVEYLPEEFNMKKTLIQPNSFRETQFSLKTV